MWQCRSHCVGGRSACNNIFLIAHLAQKQRAVHTAGVCSVRKSFRPRSEKKHPRELGETQQSASVSEWLCWILNEGESLTAGGLPLRLHFHFTVKHCLAVSSHRGFFGNPILRVQIKIITQKNEHQAVPSFFTLIKSIWGYGVTWQVVDGLVLVWLFH